MMFADIDEGECEYMEMEKLIRAIIDVWVFIEVSLRGRQVKVLGLNGIRKGII